MLDVTVMMDIHIYLLIKAYAFLIVQIIHRISMDNVHVTWDSFQRMVNARTKVALHVNFHIFSITKFAIIALKIKY